MFFDCTSQVATSYTDSPPASRCDRGPTMAFRAAPPSPPGWWVASTPAQRGAIRSAFDTARDQNGPKRRGRKKQSPGSAAPPVGALRRTQTRVRYGECIAENDYYNRCKRKVKGAKLVQSKQQQITIIQRIDLSACPGRRYEVGGAPRELLGAQMD